MQINHCDFCKKTLVKTLYLRKGYEHGISGDSVWVDLCFDCLLKQAAYMFDYLSIFFQKAEIQRIRDLKEEFKNKPCPATDQNT